MTIEKQLSPVVPRIVVLHNSEISQETSVVKACIVSEKLLLKHL